MHLREFIYITAIFLTAGRTLVAKGNDVECKYHHISNMTLFAEGIVTIVDYCILPTETLCFHDVTVGSEAQKKCHLALTSWDLNKTPPLHVRPQYSFSIFFPFK